jgi:hypothetical protein
MKRIISLLLASLKMIRQNAEAWVNPKDGIAGATKGETKTASYSFNNLSIGTYAFLVNEKALLVTIAQR